MPSTKYCISSPSGCYYPRGKVLGGSSAANVMIYVRGNKNDYDNWGRLGNPTWNWENALHYFKKSENCLDPSLVRAYGGRYHAAGGLLKVMRYGSKDPFRKTYLDAGRELGIKILEDTEASFIGLVKMLGNFDYQSRESGAKAFLIPAKNRKNLHIMYNARVTRLLFDQQHQAIGVEVTVGGKQLRAFVRREIILSAGAIASPQLLMLSGIGDATDLKRLGIEPVLHAPYVGKNFQDHPLLPLPCIFKKPSPYSNVPEDADDEIFDYITTKSGALTRQGFFDIAGYFNTENMSDPYPDIQVVADHLGKASPGFEVFSGYMNDVQKQLNEQTAGYEMFQFVFSLISAKSKGEVKLKSKNPLDYPIIDLNYFSDPHDIATLTRSIKFMLRFLNTKAFRQYQIEPVKIVFPGCAAFGTDAYWDCYARNIAATTFHPVGTVKMGPDSDRNALVDYRLRFKRINGLRVVDASIMPVIVSGNTNAPVYMIAEKAADFIKQDHGQRIA